MIMGFLAIIILLIDVFLISDILRGNFRDDTARILWLLTVLLLPGIGIIFYFTVSKNYKI